MIYKSTTKIDINGGKTIINNFEKMQSCKYTTKNFVVSAELQHNPYLLRLSLQDFVTKALYKGEYQEGDIGKGEIFRAVELEDIFSVFGREETDLIEEGDLECLLGKEIKNS